MMNGIEVDKDQEKQAGELLSLLAKFANKEIFEAILGTKVENEDIPEIQNQFMIAKYIMELQILMVV